MEFTVSKSALQTELAHLIRVTERKPTIPVLRTILVDAQSDSIRLVATDLDVTLVTSCAADVSEDGAVALSAQKLYEAVKLFPDSEISFTYSPKGEDDWATVKCGASQYRLATTREENFPKVEKSPKSFIGLPADTLQQFINRTSYAITNEESRYALNGCLFEHDDRALRMVATDGHRLAISEIESKSGNKFRVLVPKKALIELATLASERLKELKKKNSQERAEAEGKETRFSQDDDRLFFQLGHRLLIARKIAGQFPNWDLVIPKNNDVSIKLPTKKLAEVVTRMALMSDEKSHQIKVSLDKSQLTVSAQYPDVGEGRESLEVDYKGEVIEIGFNAHYCLDFLKSVSGESVVLSLKDAESPALFHPDEDSSYRYVVMPMRLS